MTSEKLIFKKSIMNLGCINYIPSGCCFFFFRFNAALLRRSRLNPLLFSGFVSMPSYIMDLPSSNIPIVRGILISKQQSGGFCFWPLIFALAFLAFTVLAKLQKMWLCVIFSCTETREWGFHIFTTTLFIYDLII